MLSRRDDTLCYVLSVAKRSCVASGAPLPRLRALVDDVLAAREISSSELCDSHDVPHCFGC